MKESGRKPGSGGKSNNQALGNATNKTPAASFTHLAQDYTTRGGVNEQVLHEMTARGVFEAFRESLDAAYWQLAGG